MLKKCLVVLLVLFIPAAVLAVGTPANTQIVNGDDNATANQADTWGDIVFEYVSEYNDTFYATSDTVQAIVDTAYDLAVIADYDTEYSGKGDTKYISYSITNTGNSTDSISLQVEYVSEDPWSYKIFLDDDNDGVHDANELTEISSVLLAEDAGESIFVAVIIPDTAVDLDSTRIRLIVTDGVGASGDSWPNLAANSRDRQTDTVLVMIAGPVLFVSKTVDTTTYGTDPYDTLIYTIYYDNDGSGTATNVVIYDVLPRYTTWVVASIDTSGLHDTPTCSASVAFDTDFSGPFESAEGTNVQRIRITLLTNISPNDGDVYGTVQNTATDKDAGYIRFRVTIN
ncbi:MAG: hypothetical protein AB1765_05655 [Candidatus Hydrogenedentota bacterium]